MNTLVSKCRFSWAVALIAMAALALSAPTALANTALGAPIGLVVAPGNAKLVVGWIAPQDGMDDTAYTVQYKSSAAPDKAGDLGAPATGWVNALYGGKQKDRH